MRVVWLLWSDVISRFSCCHRHWVVVFLVRLSVINLTRLWTNSCWDWPVEFEGLDCSIDIPDIGFQREDLFYFARVLCGTDVFNIRRAELNCSVHCQSNSRNLCYLRPNICGATLENFMSKSLLVSIFRDNLPRSIELPKLRGLFDRRAVRAQRILRLKL